MSRAPAPSVAIPEIRDYQRINAELARLLDQGHPRVRLQGAEGQRLLVAGLRGPWQAVVELEGSAGPELAAELDAPGLLIVCHGPAADGAARGLRAGRLLIRAEAGDAVGYALAGGVVIVRGAAGHRAGLGMAGGTLVLLGPTGRLCGEFQAGGRLFAVAGGLGPHASRARRGGDLVLLDPGEDRPPPPDPAAAGALHAALAGLEPWLTPP